MSIQHVNAISNRLGLRPPQKESLEILSRLCETVSLAKDADPAVALEALRRNRRGNDPQSSNRPPRRQP